jgi:hypothetical protein
MSTSTTPAVRCPGCGHAQPPTERCPRCGWNLSIKLWQGWIDSKRQGRRARRPTTAGETMDRLTAILAGNDGGKRQ